MSYNSADLIKYKPLGEPGEDLLMLDLVKSNRVDNYEATVTRLAHGFGSPIDAVMRNDQLYVIETSGGVLSEVSFKPSNGTPVGNTVVNAANDFTAYFNCGQIIIEFERSISKPITVYLYSTSDVLLASKSAFYYDYN